MISGASPLRADSRYSRTHAKAFRQLFRQLFLKQVHLPVRKGKGSKHRPRRLYNMGRNLEWPHTHAKCAGNESYPQASGGIGPVPFQVGCTFSHRNTFHFIYRIQHMFVVNGSSRDKWAGVPAVLSPRVVPYRKNVIQHTSRILQLTIAVASGDVHLMGICAPHDKSEEESKKILSGQN